MFGMRAKKVEANAVAVSASARLHSYPLGLLPLPYLGAERVAVVEGFGG